jgi:hypothetical protein
MRKNTTICFIFLAMMVITLRSFAQKTVVTETKEHLGGTVNPAFSVFIENAEYKTVLKAWKTYFEDHKGKVETSKNDVTISDAVLTSLSATPVAIFSSILEEKTGVKIIAAFTKEGQYVCTKYLPSETIIVKKIVYDFALSIIKEMVQKEIDDALKVLEDLRDKNRNLVDKKAGLEKDIQSYNKKIEKMEGDILKDTEMTAEDKAKQEKDIQNQKSKISEAESDIKTNEQQQSEMKVKVENQVKVVEDLKTKMGSID